MYTRGFSLIIRVILTMSLIHHFFYDKKKGQAFSVMEWLVKKDCIFIYIYENDDDPGLNDH